jgi:precorrin-6B C5,15-methyltransferase / cobalt-precorrin-6B C5,C15-methyltransferase
VTPDEIAVVGIGADGWAGLPESSRAVVSSAEVIFGSSRQLALLPATVTGDRIAWPSPLVAALPGLLADHHRRAVCVLASGDPMFHGIGATLGRLVGPERLRVLPHPSSVSLAAARLGWALESVVVHSLVQGPVESVLAVVNPGQRVLVLSAGARTPGEVASLLTAHGYGSSRLTVLSRLGGPDEQVVSATAASWAGSADPLNVVAIDCDGPATAVVPGLPDDLYESDGQLTKREVRAVTVSALAPVPGELLWDVGAGSGSIGIEWMRSHRTCRAVAVESSAGRVARIRRNAAALGVPGLTVVEGRAPAALTGLPTPTAIFIGGGLTTEGLIDACLSALPPGGRLVANAVTLESEAVLASWYAKLGGDLTRLAVHRASPVGGFTGWRAMMPVTIWATVKP